MANPDIAQYGVETRFQPGVSGNPKGRPKGSLGMTTIVQQMLGDEGFSDKVIKRKPGYWHHVPNKNFAAAIVAVMIIKAMNGDVRAATWLRMTGYGNKVGGNLERELRPVQLFDMRQEQTRQYQA